MFKKVTALSLLLVFILANSSIVSQAETLSEKSVQDNWQLEEIITDSKTVQQELIKDGVPKDIRKNATRIRTYFVPVETTSIKDNTSLISTRGLGYTWWKPISSENLGDYWYFENDYVFADSAPKGTFSMTFEYKKIGKISANISIGNVSFPSGSVLSGTLGYDYTEEIKLSRTYTHPLEYDINYVCAWIYYHKDKVTCEWIQSGVNLEKDVTFTVHRPHGIRVRIYDSPQS